MTMVTPEERSFSQTFDEAFRGIDVLKREHLTRPCLVLLFATLDACAALAVPETAETSRKHFIAWVDRYVLPHSSLSCSAIELYSARCSMLHSLSAHSSLTRRGESRQVCYAWGSVDAERLAAELQIAHPNAFVVLRLEALDAALREGWQRFLSDVLADEELFDRAYSKAGRLYSTVPGDTPFKSDHEDGA